MDKPDKSSIARRFQPYILAAIILLFVISAVLFYTEIIDDAFISFRYAENLVNGHGLVFNIGERVEGYSNFLWTSLIALAIKFGIEPGLAAKFLGLLFSISTIYLSYLLSRRVMGKDSNFVYLVPLLLSTSSCFLYHALGGLETALFAFLIILGFYLYLNEESKEDIFPASAIALGLASLTRPEGIGFFAVILAHKGFFRIRDFFRNGRTLVRRNDLIWLALFLSIFGSHMLWRIYYYGSILPNTFFAKMGGGIQKYEAGLAYAKDFLAQNGGIIFIVLLLAAVIEIVRRKKELREYSGIAAMAAAFFVFIVFEGGDWMAGFRFFMPALPFYFLLVTVGLKSLYDSMAIKVADEKSWGLLAMAVLWLVISLCVAVNSPPDYVAAATKTISSPSYLIERFEHSAQSQSDFEPVAQLGLWLRQRANPEATIALEDCGMIPYYSRLRTIDEFGLMDPVIARLPGAMHQKYDVVYVLSKKPDYILLHVGRGFIGGFPNDWAMSSSKEFQLAYKLVKVVSSMGNSYFLVYQREDTQTYRIVYDFAASIAKAKIYTTPGIEAKRIEEMVLVQAPEAWTLFRDDDETRFNKLTGNGAKDISGDISQVEQALNILEEDFRVTIREHPGPQGERTHLAYSLKIPARSQLVFSIGFNPLVWSVKGDGVEFEVYITSDGKRNRVFRQYVDPRDKRNRMWINRKIDLKKYEGQTVAIDFVTFAGRRHDSQGDLVGWGNPHLAIMNK